MRALGTNGTILALGDASSIQGVKMPTTGQVCLLPSGGSVGVAIRRCLVRQYSVHDRRGQALCILASLFPIRLLGEPQVRVHTHCLTLACEHQPFLSLDRYTTAIVLVLPAAAA